jgi:ATP-dependent helicase HepA
VPQWREELRDRFSLAAGGSPASELCVLPHEKAFWLAKTAPELIVVDEAHRLIRETTPLKLKRLSKVLQIVPRLLLVSATPVLGHEHELLRMLSWLEPDVYRTTPDDLAALRHRLEQRQVIGRELLALLPGSDELDPYPLAGSAERLRALFGGENAPFHDPIVLCRCEELRRLAEQDPLDETAVRRVLLELRLHISECYRLHRRLIRNRRRSLGLTLAQRQSPGIEYDLDPDRRRRIWRAFEAWREHLAARAEALPPSQTVGLAASFRELVQAVGSWAPWAATLVRARLGLSHPTGQDAGSLQAVGQVPLQPGETPLLEELLHELDQEGLLNDRVRLLVKLFELESVRGKMPRKTVVFTATTTVCLELARRLGLSLQRPPAVLHAGQTADVAQQQVDHFRTDEACQVMVCDRTGEEGRNFQFAGRLVHFDLPLDPFAVEQRIGRLDRLSRVARTLPSIVLLGDTRSVGFDEHWFRLLDEGFRVFTGPISDLHLYVEQELPRLLQAGFLQGRQAWSAAIAQVRQDIERERQNNREQDILDAVELDAEMSAQFFRRLEEYEDDIEPFRRAVTRYLEWVNRIDLFEYRRLSAVRRRQYHDWNNVLMRRDWFDQISPYLAEEPAWDRPEAQRHPDRPFLRLGHALVDLLERFSREDDRGQAFLMWRVRRGQMEPEAYCRLHYVIEAGLEALRKELAGLRLPPGREPELLRLADLFFPPRVEVLFLQENLEPVRDVSLRELLRRAYDKDAGDVNLGNPGRAGVLDQHIGAVRWANLCRSLREAAMQIIEASPAHQDSCRQAEQDLGAYFTRRREQLALALQHAGRAARNAQLAVEETIQTALEQVVRRPAIRPDAVGVILLAGGSCPC